LNGTVPGPPVLEDLAERIRSRRKGRYLVAIDGVDGSGKTTFADRLADTLRDGGEPVIRIRVDDFLNLRARRHARGRTSPEGFWLDSYDYEALERDVLSPLSAGGSGRYRHRATDPDNDVYIETEQRRAPEDSITIVDGIFLHRNELVRYWDFSIFLDVPFDVSVVRMAARDGTAPDPRHPSVRRYVAGQQLYFAACQPWSRATVIIDNTDWSNPRIVTAAQRS
jgi:uridine kinase